MKLKWMKIFMASSMAVIAILGSSSPVLAKEPEIPIMIQPRFSDVMARNIKASFASNTSVKCSLNIRATSLSTKISGTLTLSGSDGSEYSWDISGTGSVSFSKTQTGCNADEYTLSFSGYCGSDNIDIESTASR